jgi:FkbM family methyltransferase
VVLGAAALVVKILPLARLLRGATLTLKTLGPAVAVREALRRLLGLPYGVNGVEVRSSSEFRIIRALRERGHTVRKKGEWVEAVTYFGVFRVPEEELELLAVLAEDHEGLYGTLDVEGRVVLDVGAFIGDTAAFFARRGAAKVYAFEPVPRFYELLLHNVRLNGLEKVVVPVNLGLGMFEGELRVEVSSAATGLRDAGSGGTPAKVAPMEVLLEHVDGEERSLVAKIDCEGCEYSLLCTPCESLKRVQEYVVEVHGPAPLLNDKMRRCGFLVEELLSDREWPWFLVKYSLAS